MVQTGKSIKDMSVTELKALAYDCFGAIEMNQQNIRALNAAIAEKSKPEIASKEPGKK